MKDDYITDIEMKGNTSQENTNDSYPEDKGGGTRKEMLEHGSCTSAMWKRQSSRTESASRRDFIQPESGHKGGGDNYQKPSVRRWVRRAIRTVAQKAVRRTG